MNAQEYPVVYAQLGTPLFEQNKNFEDLSELKLFKNDTKKFDMYKKMSKKMLETGLAIDISKDKKEIKDYLINLRKLQKLHDEIETSYKQKLYKSIYDNDVNDFYMLMQVPLPFISVDARLKKKVVVFYKNNKNKDLPFLKHLSKDLALDEKSYAYLDQMFQLRQEKQKVQSLKSLNAFVPKADTSPLIQMVSVKTDLGYDLYLENHSFYDVTIKLEAKVLENLHASVKLPHINSYPARSRNLVANLSIIEKGVRNKFETYFSGIQGRLVSQYNKNYLYALPFHRGSSHQLTQGFYGKYTHKGRSKFSLDFKMNIGTPVHAMRDGIVIGTESKHTEHGFSAKFAAKSNYIIIQHDDGTMAMYGHLDTGGVSVRVGQEVKKHQKIGFSGNTGYSSGPHLHVHISAMRSFDKGPMSIPFRFLAKRGKVQVPVDMIYYTAH